MNFLKRLFGGDEPRKEELTAPPDAPQEFDIVVDPKKVVAIFEVIGSPTLRFSDEDIAKLYLRRNPKFEGSNPILVVQSAHEFPADPGVDALESALDEVLSSEHGKLVGDCLTLAQVVGVNTRDSSGNAKSVSVFLLTYVGQMPEPEIHLLAYPMAINFQSG